MTPDDYLATLAPAQKGALDFVRKVIKSAAPDLEERMSSGAPFFWYQGKRAVGFGAAKTHLSLYIMHGSVLKNHLPELQSFSTSSTVIRFTPDKPLPEVLILRLVHARLREIMKSER